jgi:hypothetical protein
MALDFEKETTAPRAPFRGLALMEGRGGEAVFVEQVVVADGGYCCRCEDDVAADVYADDLDGLLKDYGAAGWEEVARVRAPAETPKRRRRRAS